MLLLSQSAERIGWNPVENPSTFLGQINFSIKSYGNRPTEFFNKLFFNTLNIFLSAYVVTDLHIYRQ